MTHTDLRVLCTALGFAVVVMRGGNPPNKESALRAAAIAALMEEYCRTTMPDVFEETVEDSRQNDTDLIDELVTALELCLECEGGLSWAAEHDAQIVVARARSSISNNARHS